jgi:multiple sugar transport system permease protein
MKLLRVGGIYGGLFLLSVFALVPAIWMVITAFKTNQGLYNVTTNPWFFHPAPTAKHLIYLFTHTHFLTFVGNSVIIGVCVVAITLLLSVPAAYSLARFTGRWGERSGMAIFLVYLIPPTLLFIPLYEMVAFLGLANSIWGLVVVYPTITVPFCTWLLLGFFKSIPRDLDEAAMMDGNSRLGSFLKVALPLALPGIGTCIVFAFSLQLGDYIYAATFVTSGHSMPVSTGVPTQLIRGDVYFWQSLMGANMVVSIPLVLAYGLLFNKLVMGFQSAGA